MVREMYMTFHGTSILVLAPEDVEAEFGEDSEDVVADDAGNNADLCIRSQSGEYRVVG